MTSVPQAESTSPAEPYGNTTSPAAPAALDSATTDLEEDLVVSSERLGYAAIFVMFVAAVGWCTLCGGFRRTKGVLRRADRANYKRVGDEDLEK